MIKLKQVEIHQLIFPTMKELSNVILDKEFLADLLLFKTRSAIPDGLSLQMCWKMKGLLNELKNKHPDLTYVSVYFDNERGEEFIYEGDLQSALEIVICYRPYI